MPPLHEWLPTGDGGRDEFVTRQSPVLGCEFAGRIDRVELDRDRNPVRPRPRGKWRSRDTTLIGVRLPLRCSVLILRGASGDHDDPALRDLERAVRCSLHPLPATEPGRLHSGEHLEQLDPRLVSSRRRRRHLVGRVDVEIRVEPEVSTGRRIERLVHVLTDDGAVDGPEFPPDIARTSPGIRATDRRCCHRSVRPDVASRDLPESCCRPGLRTQPS